MSALIAQLLPHLVIAPIGVPMLMAAVMLLVPERLHRVRLALNTGAMALVLFVAAGLLLHTAAHGTIVYRLGGWAPPFGIVLVVALAALVGLCAMIFSTSRWSRAGVHFNALAQLQLMGLSGAFLTGDLFNLFVFFEILLAASYGLLLHGSGRSRVVSGLHYIAVNLVASSLFLIGVATLYAVTGTLNLADLARHATDLDPETKGLFWRGAGTLAVAFLMKAGMWPLNMWLSPAYTAATAPSASFFAVLTKVGVYALFRTWTLLFPGGEGGDVLLLFGLVTAVLSAVGMLGSQRLGPLASFSLMASAGTLIAALGLGDPRLTGGSLFYLLSSTLTASAFFLLVDLIERWRNMNVTIDDWAPFLTPELIEEQGFNLDDEQQVLFSRPVPRATAFLGLAFIACTVLVAGLPPLSGFLGKAAMLSPALGAGTRGWLFVAVQLLVGLLGLIAMLRAGIRYFWAEDREAPKLRFTEGFPLVVLLGACLALTFFGGPMLELARETAAGLHARQGYVDAVLHGGGGP